MRRKYLDNIRWMTVVLVVIYHVLYMYNAEGILGTIGKITDLKVQYYDVFQYVVYPWFMPVLFVVAGIGRTTAYISMHEKDETGVYTGAERYGSANLFDVSVQPLYALRR